MLRALEENRRDRSFLLSGRISVRFHGPVLLPAKR